MLEEKTSVRDDAGEAETQAGDSRRPAAIGPAIARLCEAVAGGHVIAVVSSEQRGESIARAVAALSSALVLWCPSRDTFPGEDAPSSPAIAGRRFAALAGLQNPGDRPVLLIADAASAAQKVAPPGAFQSATSIVTGQPIDGESLAEALEPLGYFRDDRVDEPGELAVRGSAIDIFPSDAELPVRIHIANGKVERMIAYDPVSQLGTGDDLGELLLHPCTEPEPGPGAVTLFDHLPGAAILIDPDAAERRDHHAEIAGESPAAKAHLVGAGDWKRAFKNRRAVELVEDGEQPGRRFVEAANPERMFLSAFRKARERGDRILVAGSARDIRFLSRRLEKRTGEAPVPIGNWSEVRAAPKGALMTATAELENGWSEPGLLVVATADVLGARALEPGRTAALNPLAHEVTNFHVGDAVIHEDHGLGVLRGLEPVTTFDIDSDAIRLEYAGEAQRLVPVEEADRLWRYGAEAEAVSLDRLDGSSWQKRRAEIDATIAETARHLVVLAEERAGRTAPVLEPGVAEYERFAAGFAFSETPDQARAIAAVRDDLASGKPMDRLVVGDVGYGKTEVALRAAAIAALAGKQVALIAPTTVLVRQHIETFRKRFKASRIEVAGLSRLSSPAEARETKKGLADGSIRIVVGTQMIAGKTVEFHDLGVVIIDEEQRFGAADKRKIRELGGVHVLTLTATPIPRTLQTALVGLQDLSLITTPPARRLPSRTQVGTFDPDQLRSALRREKRRGGQSFFVVPRIEDMEPMAEKLGRLVPQLKLRQAHGKMPAAEIDEEMVRFAGGDGDILLATNIIEAGLDIPRANTMIVHRADRFGLAQLHQLRGRIGRGRARGYLFLTTDADAQIAPATLKRLRTMEALDQLGAGFAISARDLDLRGAGELLGEEQAGHMKLIGLGLYQHLLGQALRVARGETVEDWTADLHLGLSGRLPPDWIPEEEVRVNLYSRIARLASGAQLDALADELEDRFGSVPDEAHTLLELARIRQLARRTRIARIDAGPAAIALTPRADFQWTETAGLVPKGGRLLLKEPSKANEARLRRVRELLELLVQEE